MLTETSQCDNCKKIMAQTINKPNLLDIDADIDSLPYPIVPGVGFMMIDMHWRATDESGLSSRLLYCNHECMLEHMNGEFLRDMLHAREKIAEREENGEGTSF